MWHGMLLSPLGLIMGLVAQTVRERAHGPCRTFGGRDGWHFPLALGAAWNEVWVLHPVKVTAYCTALYGRYVNWLVTSIAAAFGTAAHSLITWAGQSGQPWQESVVAKGFSPATIGIITTSILFLWGPRGTAAEVNEGWKHSEFKVP
jgi:hydroxylaminobenzene mutase